MTDWSRRAVLASGVAGLTAAAGCSSLPVVGESDDRPSYDYQRLQGLADPDGVSELSVYPGAVPDRLAETHYERGQSLLDGVPVEPSVPNEVVSNRLRDRRERAAADFTEAPGAVTSVDGLSGWRAARQNAAEARGAYDAASGDLTRADVANLRSSVRTALASFRDDWAYRGESVEEALAVHRRLERLETTSRRSLVDRNRLPGDLQAAVLDAGEVVGSLEEGRAAAADAAGLCDAYVTDDMDAYVDDIATAASRLEGVVASTRRTVGPDIGPESRIDDFGRDLEETPAAALFRVARGTVVGASNVADGAMERGDYAAAVASLGRILVDVVAAGAAVEAIVDGEHGQPASTDAIIAVREEAVTAVDDVLPADPGPVEAIVGWPARRTLRDAESELGGHEFEGDDWTPGYRDVMRAVGRYAYAVYAAEAVPAVVDRVTSELQTVDR